MTRSPLLILVTIALLGLSCGKKSRADEQKLIRQGKGYLQRGKRERGIQALKQAFNLNPGNVDTTIVLAKALLENNDPRNASIALSTHLSKNKGSAYLWYLLGLSRYQERKSDAAIESLDEALKRKRAYPEAILLLGKIYEEHKELVAAKEAYLSVADNMALGKALTPILVKLARIELSSDKESERANGVAHLLAALKLDPSSRDANSALGLQYLKDKKPKRAIELFSSWIKHNPKDGMGHLHLGQALLMDTQYEKAIAQYEKAALLRPQDTLPLMGIAEVAAIIKKPERVYSALVKASALQPKNTGVKWRLIPFHMERERFEVALKSLIAVKGAYGTRPEYYTLLTDAYFGLGEYASAYEAHMKRLSLGVTPTDAFLRRAGILARQAGYYPKAVEYLRPLLIKHPEDTEIKLNLALALWNHEPPEPKKEGLTLLEEMAKSDWVIPSVWWAWYLIQAEKLNEAQKVLDRARTLLKKDTVERLFYLDVLAGLYYARKDYSNFVATVKKQLPLSQNSEERRALKVRLNDGLKMIKGETTSKPGSCGALPPGDPKGAACGTK